MSTITRQWLLARRPQGAAQAEDFQLVERELPAPADGEVLVRNHFLSLDPYMRGRMDDNKSYAAPQPLGEVMVGSTAGEVLVSRNPRFAAGDFVVGYFGWQTHGLSDGKGLSKVDAQRVPLSAYLGCVGMPGVTAWYGLNRIIEPKAGQTIVVSAAAGAVGSVVGQLARLKGCRVVGIAGGPDKCALVTGTYGFDACIDYKAGGVSAALKAAAPGGIDGVFENVGGAVFDAVLQRMNAFGRIAVCGLISRYDGAPMPINNFHSVLINRLRVEGFIISEHNEVWPEALRELGTLVAEGRLHYRETIAEGIEAAPEAFIGLLKGRNVGKQLVKLI
ncbi:MAG: NADP-dependent oxidoreductase [Burkholderiales bacterium]|nr:NADP-dependent oxidoreductase [Burkholderiales bacterium]ODU66532.1 MAG: NADP-dependent oxidoreductase [Lautropia sp. SCN 66-9]